VPERLSHPSLPEDIIVAYESYHAETSGGEVDISESITGTILLKKMADLFMNIPRIDVFTEKYEKPKAFVNGTEISVSFSHTRTGLAAGISENHNVGVDIEGISREVHPRLVLRMKHRAESEIFYKDFKPIQIWTMKEAALKQIGTGLRKPMNSVKVDRFNDHIFNVEFDDGKQAKICSFQYKDHWISICYHNNSIK
jgi:phosphopantetheinyl transferase